jgi:hypothetical protein
MEVLNLLSWGKMDIFFFVLFCLFHYMNLNEIKQSHKVQFVLYFTLQNNMFMYIYIRLLCTDVQEKRGCGVLVITFVYRLQKN